MWHFAWRPASSPVESNRVHTHATMQDRTKLHDTTLIMCNNQRWNTWSCRLEANHSSISQFVYGRWTSDRSPRSWNHCRNLSIQHTGTAWSAGPVPVQPMCMKAGSAQIFNLQPMCGFNILLDRLLFSTMVICDWAMLITILTYYFFNITSRRSIDAYSVIQILPRWLE